MKKTRNTGVLAMAGKRMTLALLFAALTLPAHRIFAEASSPATQAGQGRLKIYILAGQSNMVGPVIPANLNAIHCNNQTKP